MYNAHPIERQINLCIGFYSRLSLWSAPLIRLHKRGCAQFECIVLCICYEIARYPFVIDDFDDVLLLQKGLRSSVPISIGRKYFTSEGGELGGEFGIY